LEQEEAPAAEDTTESDYRVDEDGTEWYEDEAGVWWYRMQGEDDWQEWTD